MKLICRNFNGDSNSCSYACVEISKEEARQLLQLRAVWKKLQKTHPLLSSLYRIETFGSSVEWLDGIGAVACGDDLNDDEPDVEARDYELEDTVDCEWIEQPDTMQPISTKCRLAVAAMSVTESGIYWTAGAKHSNERFETAELIWSQLKTIAKRPVKLNRPQRQKRNTRK